MFNTARWLHSNTDIRVDFLLINQSKNNNDSEARRLGCGIYRIPGRRHGIRSYFKDLEIFFVNHAGEYQAVHFCTGNLSTVAPLKFAKKAGIPIRIIHSHNSSCVGLHNKILHAFNRRRAINYSTHLLACSEAAAEFFFKKRDAQVIRNGVDLKVYGYDEKRRTGYRKEFGIPDDFVTVGFIARLTSVKNPEKMVEIFRIYHDSNPKSRLIIAGDGEKREDTEKAIKENRLEESVIMAGMRDDIPEMLSMMDILVLPSLFEGLPFVTVEAQANGLPCLVTEKMSPKAKMSEHFIFMSPFSPNQEWAAKIGELIEMQRKHPGQREEKPQGVIKAGFSTDSMMEDLLAIYEQ